jgi:hypothetical protein
MRYPLLREPGSLDEKSKARSKIAPKINKLFSLLKRTIVTSFAFPSGGSDLLVRQPNQSSISQDEERGTAPSARPGAEQPTLSSAQPDVEPPSPSLPELEPEQPHRVRSYTSLAASIASDIPVYIPTFNNPTYLANMIRQLKEWNINNIIIIDNGSKYDVMLRLLERMERTNKVIRFERNFGPRYIIRDMDNLSQLPELFCVTDPDLEFNPRMPQNFIHTLLQITNKFRIGKAGLALDIQDRQLMKQEKFMCVGNPYYIWEWESQFWAKPLGESEDGSPLFKADIDTTFAVYNKKFYRPYTFFDKIRRRQTFLNAIRLGGNYTCKHLPWYRDSKLPVAEEEFYKNTQKYSIYSRDA